jgi:hypothetical protein
VQAAHAAVQFGFEHPEIHFEWYSNSNYLGFLSVENEAELIDLIDKCNELNIKLSVFREPDIDNQITAICLEPGFKSKKICRNIKLALIDS